MLSSALLLLNIRCLRLCQWQSRTLQRLEFYSTIVSRQTWNVSWIFLTIDDSRLTKKMIRERNPEWSVARDVAQRCERRLKKNFFYIIWKYHSIQFVREQQIYGFAGHMSGQNRYFCQSL